MYESAQCKHNDRFGEKAVAKKTHEGYCAGMYANSRKTFKICTTKRKISMMDEQMFHRNIF